MMMLRGLHKWLGILIGAQVLIWVVSGAIISILDHDLVSAKSTLLKDTKYRALLQNPDEMVSWRDTQELNSLPEDTSIKSISLKRVGNAAVYLLETPSGRIAFNAVTGGAFSLDKDQARSLALQSYSGTGSIMESNFDAEGFSAVPDNPQVWQFKFDDDARTHIYLSALDGRVLAHRNKYWRVVDFLLMLHFMDYFRNQGFNSPQIIAFGFLALWMTLSGLLLVSKSFTRRDFTRAGLLR